jgi:thioredoxin-related protein
MSGRFLPFFFLVLVGFAVPSLAAEEVEWIDSYEKGLEKAQQADKNLFILITAPTWCGPCQWMEANTFEDEDVIDFINSQFIAVKVLDKVEGKKNPELQEFDFRGFPTVFVYNPEGQMLTSAVGAVGADELLDRVSKYTDADYDPSEHFLTFTWDGGYFEQVAVKTWEVKRGGDALRYREIKRGDYIYIFNESKSHYIAIPVNGGMAHESDDQGKNWQELNTVKVK